MFANLFATRRFGATRTARRCGSNRRPSRTLQMEPLEGRVLLDAAPVFDSVLGVGNDTAWLSPGRNIVDAAGNTNMTGTLLKGAVDFDPNNVRPTAPTFSRPGDRGRLRRQYAPDNSLVWARRMGGDFVWGTVNANDPGTRPAGSRWTEAAACTSPGTSSARRTSAPSP